MVLLGLFGCAEAEEDPADLVSTKLEGEVFLGEPGRTWQIEVYELLPSGQERIVERVSSNDGKFAVDLGYRSGTFYVRASSDSQEQLSAYVEVSLDETKRVFLTPVTHLCAVRAQVGEGALADRLERAKTLVYGHFGGLAHDEIRPFDVRREPAVSFTDDVTSGFLLEGLRSLARNWSEGTEGAVSTGRLLDALSADLLSDGVFDGRGERDREIRVGGRGLDGGVLRADLGRALLRFAESEQNVTVFGREDLVPLAEALSVRRTALFPEGETEPLDDEGPVFVRWFFERDGVQVPADRPVRGTVDLFVEVRDEGPIERIAFSIGDQAASGTSLARFEVDTTLLGEGAQTAEVVATDEAGNTSRLDIPFEVDNTPPILTVPEIGRVGGDRLPVEGSAIDDRGPVDAVWVTIGAEEVGRSTEIEGAFRFEADVVCGRRFTVVVNAQDRAGNETEVRREVLCDGAPPIIEVLSSVFVQEDSLEAVHVQGGASIDYVPVPGGLEQMAIDAFTAWPIRIKKYVNRLDDLDPLGTPGGGPNIPRIRLRATELAGQPVASAWEALSVEYRYVLDGAVVRDWTLLQPVGGLPEYEVPISHQALGPELSTVPPTAEHVVEVRATDEAGLSTTRAFPFSMDLLSPPVLLSNCRLSSGLAGYGMAQRNLSGLFQTVPETEAVVGTLSFPLHLPPGSPAPVHARVRVEAPGATTRVVELWEDTHYANPSHPDNNQPGCAPSAHTELEMPSGTNRGCLPGPMPGERLLERDPSGLNDPTIHATRFEVRRGTTVLSPASDDRYALSPDTVYEVRTFVVGPRVRFGGVEYDFRQTFALPNGYVFGPYPPRYRLDRRWHEGVERPRYGSFDPNRAFVTRPYIKELDVVVDPVGLTAELAGRPEVAVSIQRVNGCDGPLVHQMTAL